MKESKVNKAQPKYVYFNRELSWLAFNRRVLEQAYNDRYPLLERMRFLSFVSSNLDEFFEIRVAGLIQQAESELSEVGIDGLTVKEQLKQIQSTTKALVKDQYACWHNIIGPLLRKEKIFFKSQHELEEQELVWLKRFFEKEIYPVLTPLAIDPAHPFPQLSNKNLNILLALEDKDKSTKDPLIAVVPVPRILPRVISVEKTTNEETYVFLSELIRMFASQLFPGYKVIGSWPFRITRNSDLYFDEEEIDNLLQKIEEELRKMRRGTAVRLEIREGVDSGVLGRLLDAIQLQEQHVFKIDGPVDLRRLFSVYSIIDRPELKFDSFTPFIPNSLSNRETIFQSIDKKDRLLHHPYDSFVPVVDFINAAAKDPDVFAIKLTLYRTSGDSPILEALKEASLRGKQVTALIELKARFDEANNIQWARELEQDGVHVVYGLVGLKTHCKCCLVVRREGGKLKRYVHLGTGNYNPKTAKAYTDFSFLTTDSAIAVEVADLFNALTGLAHTPKFKKLLVAPFNLHEKTQLLILNEIKNAKAGKKAKIIIKLNNLVDKETIDNLYLASQAGVCIELIVRGICCLVPGVKGVSDNIRVRSILGRYLEHSRIYYFENGGGKPLVYLGSADWMPRNFFRRIEVVFPVDSPEAREFIIKNVLPIYVNDTQEAKFLDSKGAYSFLKQKDENNTAAQQLLIEQVKLRQEKQEKGAIEPVGL